MYYHDRDTIREMNENILDLNSDIDSLTKMTIEFGSGDTIQEMNENIIELNSDIDLLTQMGIEFGSGFTSEVADIQNNYISVQFITFGFGCLFLCYFITVRYALKKIFNRIRSV